VSSTDKDLRYYMLRAIEEDGTVVVSPLANWKLVPEKWVSEAKDREYRLLFGKGN
jgi:2',3'-cyclic-nucleotide 2'-phosphodiesterase/3'-nucleotidase